MTEKRGSLEAIFASRLGQTQICLSPFFSHTPAQKSVAQGEREKNRRLRPTLFAGRKKLTFSRAEEKRDNHESSTSLSSLSLPFSVHRALQWVPHFSWQKSPEHSQDLVSARPNGHFVREFVWWSSAKCITRNSKDIFVRSEGNIKTLLCYRYQCYRTKSWVPISAERKLSFSWSGLDWQDISTVRSSEHTDLSIYSFIF